MEDSDNSTPKSGAPARIVALLKDRARPMSAQHIASNLNMPYSTVTNSLGPLVEKGAVTLVYTQRNRHQLRASPMKFYTAGKVRPSTPLSFPWKINPKGYNNGYETQSCSHS